MRERGDPPRGWRLPPEPAPRPEPGTWFRGPRSAAEPWPPGTTAWEGSEGMGGPRPRWALPTCNRQTSEHPTTRGPECGGSADGEVGGQQESADLTRTGHIWTAPTPGASRLLIRHASRGRKGSSGVPRLRLSRPVPTPGSPAPRVPWETPRTAERAQGPQVPFQRATHHHPSPGLSLVPGTEGGGLGRRQTRVNGCSTGV